MKNTILLLVLSFIASNIKGQSLQEVTDIGSTTSNTISINTGNEGLRLVGNSYLSFRNAGNLSRVGYLQHDGDNLVISSDVGNVRFTNNVGIGTIYPTQKLTIDGSIKINGQSRGLFIQYATLSESLNGASTILGNNVKAGLGNNTVQRFVSPDDPGSYVSLNYYHGITFHTGVASALNTDISSTDNEVMRITQAGNVGIGTTDTKGYRFAVNGKIRAQEIKVEASPWPDYVFTKDYQLPSLQQTEQHIKENGHLPGIPSAAEVKANGIDLGEMNSKLLQKIEELTLHLIEKDKQIQKLEKRMSSLESKSQ
ncbi:hypothetical protein [Pedobacter heparinus]|uniref:hypothetical protein n=1 Tax=Pedobacter heparinus TaxID=984 RepID=UPI00292E9CA8|nr:hypothetical protein [Pedobacter heparinus]